MLLLLLSLFLHYDIFHCDVFERADSNRVRTEHEASRNHNLKDFSIADIMWNSTPGIDLLNWIAPDYSHLFAKISHDTHLPSSERPTPKEPSFTDKLLHANRRNLKIPLPKLSKRQQKNNVFRPEPRQHVYPGIAILDTSKKSNPVPEPKAPREPGVKWIKHSHTQTPSTVTKKRLFPNLLLSDGLSTVSDGTDTDDEDESEIVVEKAGRSLTLQKIPETKKQFSKSQQMDGLLVTTTKPILRQNTNAHPYFQMIGTLKEGYMMVFLIELTRLVAAKEGQAVHNVVKHTDRIMCRLFQSGKLQWLGTPLINIVSKVARLLKESKIDIIQNYAANLHQTLSQRHQKLSVEVNTILEYADMLYEDDEGRLLFESLEEFAAYPNISLTGYWLCNSLIHNFLRPYRRLKDTEQRQELLDSVNLELKSNKNTKPRSDDVKQPVGPPKENHPSPPKEPATSTKPPSTLPSVTTRSPRKRKRKRHHHSHKRKRQRKRHRINRYKPELYQKLIEETLKAGQKV